MSYSVIEMELKLANQIVTWEYESPHDFYNMDQNQESIDELLDGSYRVVVNDINEVIGFYSVGENAQVPTGHKFDVYKDDCIDIGLGMNPSLVGKGFGFEFCSFIISSIKPVAKNKCIRLTVAQFNKRAIHLYEQLGFKKISVFPAKHETFQVMVKSNLT